MDPKKSSSSRDASRLASRSASRPASSASVRSRRSPEPERPAFVRRSQMSLPADPPVSVSDVGEDEEEDLPTPTPAPLRPTQRRVTIGGSALSFRGRQEAEGEETETKEEPLPAAERPAYVRRTTILGITDAQSVSSDFLGISSETTGDGDDEPRGRSVGRESRSEFDVDPEITLQDRRKSGFIARRRGPKVDPLGVSPSRLDALIRVVDDEFVKVIRRRWTPLKEEDDDEEEEVVTTKAGPRRTAKDKSKGLLWIVARYVIALFIIAPAVAIVIQGELGMRLFSRDEASRAAWQARIDLFDLVYTALYTLEYLAVVGAYLYHRRMGRDRSSDEESGFARMWSTISVLETTVVFWSVVFTLLHYLQVDVPKLYDLPHFPITWAVYSLRVKILRLMRLPRFVFEKSYDKLMHAILKPMVTYFFPLMILLLFIITICALMGHFMFGFFTANEAQVEQNILDWKTLSAAFMSVLDFFLGDQWGDVYATQYGRETDHTRERRVIVALFVVATVAGLGMIYGAVFIAVLIFKVGEQNEEEAESNEKEQEREKIERRLEEYEESQRHLLHLLENGRLKPLSDLLEQQMYRSFRRLDLIVRERPRTTRLWMEGLVTALNWLTATHKHLLAIYQYMEVSMDEADRAAEKIRDLVRAEGFLEGHTYEERMS